jgi:hypothetical protein
MAPASAGGAPAAGGAADGTGAEGGGCGGDPAQAASKPTIAAIPKPRSDERDPGMWLIVLEALAALGLLVFIVWWTMFSGRPRGERKFPDDNA